jgi:hypothetical protein
MSPAAAAAAHISFFMEMITTRSCEVQDVCARGEPLARRKEV